jgi:ubiquinone/menaquinone biosynthesis C-methylase UbiE
MHEDFDETRNFWNKSAEDWRLQVGDHGDTNRIANSDPVLWSFLGDVRGLAVLDAGCGTGYLSMKLQNKGADVTGVDFSERMVGIALETQPGIDFRVDSCSELRSVNDEEFDVIVSNYVLMDTPDLQGTMHAFNRVLRPGGIVVLVFSHPCFPQADAVATKDGEGVTYPWSFSYFEQRKCVDPPWGHFTSDFIWFHRPLSDYWKAFTAAGFSVIDFEEPRITPDRHHLIDHERRLQNYQRRPYSVAFKLQKKSA